MKFELFRERGSQADTLTVLPEVAQEQADRFVSGKDEQHARGLPLHRRIAEGEHEGLPASMQARLQHKGW